MRKRLVLVIVLVTALASACGKKQAPASPKPATTEDDKAKEGEKSEDGGAPAPTSSDPCEGGEKPKR